MGDFYSAKTVIAAKSHRCDECKGTIAQGERHTRATQSFGGDMYSIRTCLRCDAIRHEAWIAFDWFGPEEAPGLGDLARTLREEHDVPDPDAWLAERRRLAAEAEAAKAAQARQALDDMARTVGWPLPLPPEIAA